MSSILSNKDRVRIIGEIIDLLPIQESTFHAYNRQTQELKFHPAGWQHIVSAELSAIMAAVQSSYDGIQIASSKSSNQDAYLKSRKADLEYYAFKLEVCSDINRNLVMSLPKL